MTNHITGDCDTSYSFETYGDELEYVAQQDERHIWTEMDGDNGVYIVNGFHYVNRIQYYITNKPWNDGDDICITVCEYVACPNAIEGECNADCSDCNGDGTITDWKW
jgi:hypothetical protein